MDDSDENPLPTAFDRQFAAVRPDVPLMIYERITGKSSEEVGPDIAATASALIERVQKGREESSPRWMACA